MIIDQQIYNEWLFYLWLNCVIQMEVLILLININYFVEIQSLRKANLSFASDYSDDKIKSIVNIYGNQVIILISNVNLLNR